MKAIRKEESAKGATAHFTQEDWDAIDHVRMPEGRRASKTWEAMVKLGSHVTVNDPSLLM